MSISAPLAVTMMIGTWLRLRSCRHTSMPLSLRQHHVEQHEVGLHDVEALQAPRTRRSTATTRKPSRVKPDRQRLDEARLVLDDEHDGLRSSCLAPRRQCAA